MEEENVEDKPVGFNLSDIDSSASPCNDFYQYAIGNWLLDNPVPPTESRWMSFNILAEENRKKTEEIILKTAKLTNVKKGSNEQLIRDLYLSAYDSVQIEKKGLSAINATFSKIDKVQSVEDLATMVSDLRLTGVGSFVGMHVGRDPKNSQQYIANFDQTGISLPDKEYYLSKDEKYTTIQNQYVAHIDKMFALAGFSEKEPGKMVLEIETALAKLHWDRKDLRDPERTYNKKSVTNFIHSFKNFPLKKVIDGLSANLGDSIIVGQPSFYEGLDKMFAEKNLVKWKAYLKMKVLSSYASWAGSRFEQERFDFYSMKLQGVKEMRPRSERINRLIDGNLGEPLGKLFVDKHFPPASKAYMVTMIENLREAYRERILNLTWMGDSTKEKAIKKLNSFTYKVGYPDVWKDYSSIDITPDNLIQNLINISEFQFKLMIDKLGKPIDKNEWYMSPQTVNAYYSSSGNEIVFPAGILQPPFFHVTFDDAINYGGIGAVIGHEFTHGFDDKGSKSDWDGNLNNWWTDEDRMKFDALTKALADQYSKYEPLPGLFINGEMTLGENIADLGGLTLAYLALNKAVSGREVAPIDGFTWQQRFYLSWANIWKGNITEDELRNRILTDYHSPGEFRVKGPLANIPEFRDAFGCKDKPMVKPDSSMIRIW